MHYMNEGKSSLTFTHADSAELNSLSQAVTPFQEYNDLQSRKQVTLLTE